MFSRWILVCFAALFAAGQFGDCQRWSSSSAVPLEYEYDWFHTDKDPERMLGYFREDPSMGAINIGYHYSDPFWVTTPDVPVDRSGELFDYMHSQLVTRYDLERISNGQPISVATKSVYDPVCEAYFPDFPPYSTKYTYYARPENQRLKDWPDKFTVKDLATWWERLEEAVEMGHIIHHNGSHIPIYNVPNGLDHLVHVTVSKAAAPNHAYYGCYHTALHQMFAKLTDPFGKYYNHYDVIVGFVISTMDPAFYTTHKHVTNLFKKYRLKLRPYTERELGCNGINLHDVYVIGDKTQKINDLTTFTQLWKPTLSHGIDMMTDQPIKVLYHILNHEEFSYKLKVENTNAHKVKATVRLLLAPITTCDGPIPLEVQRTLVIELDKFKVVLSRGLQTITRHSTKSWVTVPLEKSAEMLESMPKMNDVNGVPRCLWPDSLFDQTTMPELLSSTYNLPLSQEEANKMCGWPHHLLIPKGNSTGVDFVLFAMVTNWDDDKVRSSPEQDFNDASAYCGIYNDKYPDKRAMGFPFDRPFKRGSTLQSILTPNMAIAKVKICHSDQVVPLDGTFEV